MARSEGSFIRWQSIAIDQLGYAVGLFLTFAAAALGFVLSIIKDTTYIPTCWSKPLIFASIVALLLSLAFGLWCVVNRLHDFRKTRSIARDRENWRAEGVKPEEIDKKLEDRRAETDRLGKLTWRLFRWQIGIFALGILALTGGFAAAYSTKIF